MLTTVTLRKIDIGQWGEMYEVEISGDIENNASHGFKFRIQEHEFELFKKSFSKCEKSGKWEQNETYS